MAAGFPNSWCLARMRAGSARARASCPARLGIRRDSAQDRAAGADCHAALDSHHHRARRRSPAGGHRFGPDRGCGLPGSGRHGPDHRPASAAATRGRIHFGIDRWFFAEAVGNQPGHVHPGRPAEATSIAFALLGEMLLLGRTKRAWAQKIFSIIGTGGMLLMAAALVGYLIGVGALQSVTFVTAVALHTALGLGVLFLGVLVLRADIGWMALVSGDWPRCRFGPHAAAGRGRGPAASGLVVCRRQADRTLRAGVPTGLDTLATVALLATSLLWSAARVDRLHRARLAGAEALRRSEERYRTLVEGQPDPICQFLPDTTLTFVNRAYAEFYGREPEELAHKRWLDFAARNERPRFLEELTSFTPEHPERHEETRSTRTSTMRCAGTSVTSTAFSMTPATSFRSRPSAPTSPPASALRSTAPNSSACSPR